MFNTPKQFSLDGAERCPQCFQMPEPTVGETSVTLECKRHGHMAMGPTIETAVEYWNRYIDFVRKAA